ncbi:MAG: (d)CMP kinase [Planctomycetota bacterium]|jgi:cytidylate kinase|nr:(d)CMP kinase [Planctomycetota bacterium]
MPDLPAVAIDGPAGAGKSSVARRVAGARNWLFVDTGAMYRALALKALRLAVDPDDGEALTAAVGGADVGFDEAGTTVFLDGEDVSRAIRDPKVTENVKFVARAPALREILARKQRAIAVSRPSVTEGRDICTVVLPDARWKFFLTASVEARAKRRYDELIAAGRETSLERVVRDVEERDASDFAVGPLRNARDRALAADGIVYLDTTGMALDGAAAAVLRQLRGHRNSGP